MLRISLYPIFFSPYFFSKRNPFTTIFPAFYQQYLSEHMLMVVSVNKTLEDEVNHDTSFHCSIAT